MVWLAYGMVAVLSYLLGSVNTSIVISKFYANDDIRNHGSGNAGMTNMLRTYGVFPAVMTAVGDFLKGVLAVVLARYLIFPVLFDLPRRGALGIDVGYIAGIFVLLGHVYPLYFKFKGGKAVMTTLGVIFILDPIVLVLLLAIALPFIFKTRYVSLGSVLGAALFAPLTALMHWLRGQPILADTLSALVIGILVLILHRGNIHRLLTGTEKKFTPPQKEKNNE